MEKITFEEFRLLVDKKKDEDPNVPKVIISSNLHGFQAMLDLINEMRIAINEKN